MDKLGTDGPDTLRGTNKADNLIGQGGNDIIFGGAGSDNLLGGSGKDALFGGNEFDPSRGDMNLVGGSGNYFINAGQGHDNAVGGEGNDLLIDGNLRESSFDNLVGDSGNDVIVADHVPAFQDVVTCGAGYERVIADRKDTVAADCEKVVIVHGSLGEVIRQEGKFFDSIQQSFFAGLNPQIFG